MTADLPPTDPSRGVPTLQASREALECLLRTTVAGFWLADSQGRILAVNPSYCRLSGYSEDELLNMRISELDADEAPADTARRIERLVLDGYLLFETRHRRKDGTTWHAEVSCSYLDVDGGQIYAFFRDITDRRQAAERLAQQIDFNDRMFNATDAHQAVVDRDGVIVSVNDAWRRFAEAHMGGDESTWGVGAQYFRRCAQDDGDDADVGGASEAYAGIRRVQSGELASFTTDYPCHDPGGEQRWFTMRVFRLRGDEGLVLVSHENITERRRSEAALRRSERLLATSQHLARVGGWEWDIDRDVSYWTPEMYSIYDLEPGAVDINDQAFLGRLRECYDPEDRPVIAELFRRCRDEGRNFDREFAQTTFKGRRIWIRTTAQAVWEDDRVVGVVGNAMDITERKVAEREVLKVEKLESLGVLAGGIAHDFNNILTGVMGNLSLARAQLGSADPAQRALADAELATARAEALALQLLTFARGGEPVKREIALRPLVEDTVTLTLRGSNVRGAVDIPGDVHGLVADAGQLSQAFQNIILNAMQAMPDGGELSVTAANEHRPEQADGLAAGRYVRITFADTGQGIAPEDLPRIFDPYFTTKQAGNGLGLASVYSIVARHGGRVDVESAAGQGAAFVLRLPSMGRPCADQSDRSDQRASTPARFAGRVLVMDDDELVLNLAQAMLTHLGFEVATCRDGNEAVAMRRAAAEAGVPYRLVVMDLTVPGGMGGKEAAERILDEDPAACLVVSSGYSHDPILADFGAYGFAAAVAKPYSLQQLQQVLHELLPEG